MCVTFKPGACSSQKTVLGALELELMTIVSPCVGAGK